MKTDLHIFLRFVKSGNETIGLNPMFPMLVYLESSSSRTLLNLFSSSGVDVQARESTEGTNNSKSFSLNIIYFLILRICEVKIRINNEGRNNLIINF
jgi:hypothetical protein